MVVFDDKSPNALRSGNQLLIPGGQSSEDVTFKASYCVSQDLTCDGKITALFDLIVFGDVRADEIEIKGRFVCMGHCIVSGAIIVQNDMWCEDVQAASITCHDRIVAQSIDADSIFADGSIIIGKTLAIEKKAQTNQSVICGETAYGAGKIIASSILTVEPLDLDDGEEALESPFQYSPKTQSESTIIISKESAKYEKDNDYSGYIAALIKNSEENVQKQLKKYLTVLKAVEMATPSSISDFRDAALLIWLVELSNSGYFKGWNTISEWTEAILAHFQNVAEGKITGSIQGKPAEKLLKGYTVSHTKYGIGVVEDVVSSGTGTHSSKMAIIKFEEYGVKKFPIPDALKHFLVLSETSTSSSEEIKGSMTCDINDYKEWLTALEIINENKGLLGDNLHNAIFELLIEKIGLKAKFVEDRFKEKGWG